MATRPGAASACPCGSGSTWQACCGPIVDGGVAPTAEALMCSRYSAFAVGDVEHLVRSWHPETRPVDVRMDPDRTWTGLEVVATERGRVLDATGIVTFRAHWKRRGTEGALHETSSFARVAGRWVYVDGVTAGDATPT